MATLSPTTRRRRSPPPVTSARLSGRCRALGAAAAACVLTWSTPAAAEDAGARDWYGWQTLAADVPPLVWTPAALASPREGAPFVAVGGSVFVLSGPALHGLAARPGAAVGSLALRVLIPAAGATVGALVIGLREGEGWQSPALVTAVDVGGLVGAVVAAVIDAALVGYRPGAAR